MLNKSRNKWTVSTVAVLAAWALVSGGVTLADKGGGGHGGGGGGGGGPTPTHKLVSLGSFAGDARTADINVLGAVVVNTYAEAFLIVPLDENPVDDLPDTWFKDEGSPSDPNEPDGINDLMIDLGVMDGLYPDARTFACAINSAGQIVGYSKVGPHGYDRAFLITPQESAGGLEWFVNDGSGGNAFMIDLLGDVGSGAQIYVGSAAIDISDSGFIVGAYYVYDPPDSTRRPAWIIAPERDAEGVPHTWFKDEGSLSDPNEPDGINDLMIELGTTDPANLPYGGALAVNNDGWVYGYLMNIATGGPVAFFLVIPEDTDGDGFPDAWYKDEGSPSDPNTPDGANDLMVELPYRASELNETGQVVMAGAVWQIDPATGVATLLYALEEIPSSLGEGGASALNNLGGVVGSAVKQKGKSGTPTYTPLYWQDGVLYNLFDLMTDDDGIESAAATSIDDEGRMLVGAVVNDQWNPFIAVPIPPAP